MNWIKFTFLDIVVLILISTFVFTSKDVLEIIIWIYTGILLVSKILYFFVGYLQKKAGNTEAPDWFYHLIYILSFVLLAYSQNYYLAASWAVIWILSTLSTLKKKSTAKS